MDELAKEIPTMDEVDKFGMDVFVVGWNLSI